jgi:nitrogen regulatory protein PII
MKMLIAFIHANDLPVVQEALDRRVVCLMSVTAVQSFGPEPAAVGTYRGAPFRIRRSRLRLEIALEDESVDAAVGAITGAASADDGDPVQECKVFAVGGEEIHGVRLSG